MNEGMRGLFSGLGNAMAETGQQGVKDHFQKSRLKLRQKLNAEATQDERQYKDRVREESRAYESEAAEKQDQRERERIRLRADLQKQNQTAADLPSDARMVEYMVSSGIAPNRKVAMSRMDEAKSNPAQFVANYVDQEMEAQKNAGLYPGMEGYKTTDEMRNSALKTLETIRQSTRGTDSPEPRPEPRGGQATENPDGSYSGVIDRSSQGEYPTVRSDSDYESLPPGAIFVDENGKKYQKPLSE